jgi:hypothetical protein
MGKSIWKHGGRRWRRLAEAALLLIKAIGKYL